MTPKEYIDKYGATHVKIYPYQLAILGAFENHSIFHSDTIFNGLTRQQAIDKFDRLTNQGYKFNMITGVFNKS